MSGDKEMTAREFFEKAIESMVNRDDNVVHFTVQTSEGPMYFCLTLIGLQEQFDEYQKLWASVVGMLEVEDVPKGRLN